MWGLSLREAHAICSQNQGFKNSLPPFSSTGLSGHTNIWRTGKRKMLPAAMFHGYSVILLKEQELLESDLGSNPGSVTDQLRPGPSPVTVSSSVKWGNIPTLVVWRGVCKTCLLWINKSLVHIRCIINRGS